MPITTKHIAEQFEFNLNDERKSKPITTTADSASLSTYTVTYTLPEEVITLNANSGHQSH